MSSFHPTVGAASASARTDRNAQARRSASLSSHSCSGGEAVRRSVRSIDRRARSWSFLGRVVVGGLAEVAEQAGEASGDGGGPLTLARPAAPVGLLDEVVLEVQPGCQQS